MFPYLYLSFGFFFCLNGPHVIIFHLFFRSTGCVEKQLDKKQLNQVITCFVITCFAV